MIYELTANEKSRDNYEFDATHECRAPGINCPSCGVWAMTGVSYPTISCTRIKTQVVAHKNILEADQYEDWIESRRDIFGPDRHIWPGTSFGPLIGKATGILTDVAWPTLWTILMSKDVVDRLLRYNISLRTAPSHIKIKKTMAHDLLEVEAWPTARVFERPPACSVCHRPRMSLPKNLVIDKNGLDLSIPIQRVFELPTVILVNEAVATALKAEGCNGFKIEQIELK